MEQESLPCDSVKKRKNLSPEEKYAIFMEASRLDVPVGELCENGASTPRKGRLLFETVFPT